MPLKRSFYEALSSSYWAEYKIWNDGLTKAGLTRGKPRILNYLMTHDGSNQKDIAAATFLEPPSVTSVLAVMEREDLVRRDISREDRRRNQVYITEKGKAAMNDVQRIADTVSSQALRGFTQQEVAQFRDFLNRMEENARAAWAENADQPMGGESHSENVQSSASAMESGESS